MNKFSPNNPWIHLAVILRRVRSTSRSLLGLVVLLANAPTHSTAEETIGPEKGTLVIVGGGDRVVINSGTPPRPRITRRPEGYYKDIFMDGGVNLSSRKRLPAAESLGMSYEHYAGRDADKQRELFVGSDSDTNGVLLFPDGQPRFRLVFINGGGATKHGLSLGESGRGVLIDFYNNGGSYCGSCAGSFLSGRNTDSKPDPREGYLHIFPYNTRNTGMKKERVGHFIPENSPLLNYRDFGKDFYVADIYHNNGNWLAIDDLKDMDGVEVLATYDSPDKKTHKGAAIWAWKTDQTTGRIINIGCHPEGIKSGERLELTEACFQYAVDGVGQAAVKGELINGVVRRMDKDTSDQDPLHTKIGDRQYHHFLFEVEPGTTEVQVELVGLGEFDLNLYLHEDTPAFRSNTTFGNTLPGATKRIRETLTPGRWFASVECRTTVDAVLDETQSFFTYTGNTDVLNGVAYSISIQMHEEDDLSGPPFVSATAWAIADGRTGQLLWGSNENLALKSASTTKIMCALTVLDIAADAPEVLDETLVYSELADKTGGSTSGIRAGESLTVAECLYGLLLPSGNDAGNALAEHFNDRCLPPQSDLPETINEKGNTVDYTSRRNFIAQMNRRAKELGMTGTHYWLPYGDGGMRGRTTTSSDLLRLAFAAMQNETFRKYVATREHQTIVTAPDGQVRSIVWRNTNKLLAFGSYDGIKTGTNTAAGACLVSSGRRGEDRLLVAVLGATSRAGRYVDSRNLYRWAWRQRGHRAQTVATETLDRHKIESRGPNRGILYISGGANKSAASDEHSLKVRYPTFIKLIKESRLAEEPKIVVITTAGGRDRKGKNAATLFLKDLVGQENVTELFTRSRDVANSKAFLDPISQADGVWLCGGQQGVLANTFLGTKTEQALRAILARGGVIGGSSAGAQFQSSFMTRGMNKNGPTGPIRGDGKHQKGLGFITHTAFDVHVAARSRENALFNLLATPRGQLQDKNLDPMQLLGIGIDELTAIIVCKDQFEVVGQGHVYIFNPHEWKDGVEPFYHTLSSGDRFDVRERRKLARAN